MTILNEYVGDFESGRDLDGQDAEKFLDELIIESDERLLADLFRAWDGKGITADEIYEIARLMRERCTKLSSKHEKLVDIVGTGGSRSKTFNVSTAAAFVIAGAGVPVAKHGNKAATSSSGSADVLAMLGIEPAANIDLVERCLNEFGICFMFAPNFHRLSPTLAKVRRGLGFPTIFNCVGPLCNPAGAEHRIIGVWNGEIAEKMANAFARLGSGRSWIVHGSGGLDEIALDGPTLVAEVKDDTVNTFEISPEDFGMESGSSVEMRVDSPSESADVIRSILGGEKEGTPAESIVVCNAAAAIYVSGFADTLSDGAASARESLRSGKALDKMRRLAELTNG